MAALVALRARRRGLIFQLHVNVACVRPWDDLVLFVDGPGSSVTYFLQLKHFENGGFVSLQAFQGSGQKQVTEKRDEGDFRLNKYFEKFKELSEKCKNREKLENDDEWLLCNRKLDDFRFIIYTNKEVEKPSSTPEAGGSTVFPFEDIFETGDGTNTFSFQAGDEVGQALNDALYQQQFLPRMRVLGAQAHVDRLDGLLAEEVRRQLSPRVRPAVADECAELYVAAFKRWLDGPGAHVVSQASGELESAVGEALRRRGRREAGGGALAFEGVHCACVRRALTRAGCVRVGVAGVRRGHRAAKVLQLLDEDFPERWMYVDDQVASDLRPDALLAASARCPFVVLDVDRATAQVKDFVSKVAADPMLKLVVLSSNLDRARDFPNVEWQEIEEDWRLEHLTPKTQNKLINLDMSFQGTWMSLRELQAQGTWPEERLRRDVDGPLLSALIGCDAALGEAPPRDAGAPSHVPRTLHHASVLRREVLRMRHDPSHHLVLCGFSAEELRQEELRQEELRQEELRQEELRPDTFGWKELRADNKGWNDLRRQGGADFLSDRWTILSENQSSENTIFFQFGVVSALHPKRNVHLIQNANGLLLWRETRGSPKAISKFVEPWSENCKEPYAPTCIHERSALETAVQCQQRVCLLLGEPGIGKTTFLCSLAETQRENEPHMWAVVAKLLDHVDILEDLPNENEINREHVAHVMAAAAGVATPASAGARRSLEAALFHSGAVYVFVDGVDEVLPAYRDKTLRILDLLVRETKAQRVWVAARPQVIVSLMSLLPSRSAILFPLSREEQLVYLRSKWSFASQRQDVFEDVANKLLDAYAFTPGREHSPLNNQLVEHSLLGVPFNLDMVIESYTDDVNSAIENNTTFLPKILSQLQLFKQFIQKLRERYKKRYGPSGARSKLSYNSKADDDVFHRLHQNYAMLIWASSTSPLHQKTFHESVKNYEEHVETEKSGILWKLEDGRIQFAHFTFVEYFVASWLFDKRIKDNKNILPGASDRQMTQLLETAYKNPQSRVMVFLDLMLAEGYPVHKGIIENDTETLTSHLSDVLHKDLGGRTPLHVAAAYGRSDCVNNLRVTESDLSQCDSLLQWTPLKYASATENLPTAEILLEKGANSDDLVEPAYIMQILRFDLVKILEALLARKKGRSRLEDITIVSSIPLIVAANAGSKRVVNLLIKMGAKVESKDPFGETALFRAAYEGHTDIVEILISAGADIHCRGQNEYTPLHIASEKGHVNVVRVLLSKGADVVKKCNKYMLPIHLAALNGHRPVLDLLLQTATSNAALQVLVNSPADYNYTPLHLAVKNGHKDVVEILLENGASVGAETADGDKAIHLAALYSHKEMTEVLLRHGADIHSPGQFEGSPLHCASNNGHVEVVQLLLSKGADVLKKDFKNRLPIHHAAQNGHRSVVEFLLQTAISNAAIEELANSPADDNCTPLHLAAQKGHKDVVEILIENRASVNAETGAGNKPIHLSALHGHKEVTEVLLRHGADIHSPGQFEGSPLHCASHNGHVEVVRLLLSKGADVLKKYSNNMLPIHLAAPNGHRSVVELLLQTNAALQVNSPDEDNFTPLLRAAQNGHKDVVEILIENGASVNAETGKGNKAIHLSAFHGHKEVTEVLLRHGADIHSPGQFEGSPLHCASNNGHVKVVRLLLSKGADVLKKDSNNMLPIHLAAPNGHRSVVELLLQTNAALQVNSPDEDNFTPLLRAAQNGHKGVVQILIENGASVNAETGKGNKAIHLSAFHGHKEVTEVLLLKGAVVNCRGENGSTPLHCACENGHDHVVTLLLDAGAAVESCDVTGRTALFLAVHNGHVNVVKNLLNRGADVNRTGISGLTPLHVASWNGHSLVVVSLLHKGAHVNARDNGGQSALHLAARLGHKEVVQLLLSRGADAHLVDKKGFAPIQFAISRKHHAVTEILLRESFQIANL